MSLRKSLIVSGRRLVWPARVPPLAAFHAVGHNDACVWGEFKFAGGAAQIAWSRAGKIMSEKYLDAKGRGHGLEVSRTFEGAIEWQVPWVHGQMHGIARQFDDLGRTLVRTRFVHGTGVDVWVNCGCVSEVREMVDGVPHGVIRWGHPLLPSEEDFYFEGKRCGPLRRWVGDRLEDGFPKFYLDDEEVTRAVYLRARTLRPLLQRYSRIDDERRRELHPALGRVWLRKEVRTNVMALLERRVDPS